MTEGDLVVMVSTFHEAEAVGETPPEDSPRGTSYHHVYFMNLNP